MNKKASKIQQEYRGEHEHDKEKCTYCGLCAAKCPAFAIKVDAENEKWRVDLSKCIFCGRCEMVCPVNAISFSKNFKMASKNKEDLIRKGKPEKD